MLVYDIEIEKCIPPKGEEPKPGIEYCAGWHDHANMGISVIGAYDYIEGRYRVFLEDNFGHFEDLVRSRDVIIGFNSVAFDDNVCKANGIDVTTTYDVLREVWTAAGLAPVYGGSDHAGYGLDECARWNLSERKTGHGAFAPELWQMGRKGAVIDYCLQDVKLTKGLVDEVLRTGSLRNPRNPLGVRLRLPRP